MTICALKPSEKVMALVKSTNREDQSLLRSLVRPDMLWGTAKAVYSKWFSHWDGEPITEEEFAYLDRFDEREVGYAAVNMKTLVDELKEEFEAHAIEDLLPRIHTLKASGENASSILDTIRRASSVFARDDFDFGNELAKVLNERDDKSAGFGTGFRFLECTKGLKKGHLWVVGGYTSSGKTMFTLQMLNTPMRDFGAKVMFVSLEMTQTEILDRLIHIEQSGHHSDTVAYDRVGKYRFKATDKLSRVEDIEQMILATDFDIYVVDFIQNVNAQGKSEYERLTNVVRTLQLVAHKKGVCVVAVSQISNEAAKGESQLMTFKGSGAIAAACDVGIELKRSRDFENDSINLPSVLAYVKKNRHGRLGKAELVFNRNNGLLTESK